MSAARAAGDGPLTDRRLGLLLLLAGLVGTVAATELAIDKVRLLENPLYVPACSLSDVVDCVSVMRSEQSEAFGFPNPFIGMVGFGGLAATGLLLGAGGRAPRAYWWTLQAGLTFAVAFVHWLIFQTLYRIGALCPYCMAVWAVTIPAFWYVTLHNVHALARAPSPPGRLVARLRRNHGIILTVWLLLISGLAFDRFWAPWEPVLA